MIIKKSAFVTLAGEGKNDPVVVMANCTIIIAWADDEYEVTILEQDVEGGTHQIIDRATASSLAKAEEKAGHALKLLVLRKMLPHIKEVPGDKM